MKDTQLSSRSNCAPDRSTVALLIVDVINELEFDGGELLLAAAIPMSAAVARLKKRAKAHGIPAIYVNDNFGRWRSDFPHLVKRCLENDVRGEPIVATPEDAFRCFMGTEIETLAVGNCVLDKSSQNPALKRNYEHAFELD